MTPTQVPTDASTAIAGFWRRVAAFVLDGLVLGLIGGILGTVLFDDFARLGGLGRLVGLALAWPYFAIMNSRLGGGKTIGKRLLKIRVVSASGAGLDPIAALYRSAIQCLPFFVNGMVPADLVQRSMPVAAALSLLLGVGLVDVYLFAFNRRTRQSLHDLAVNSCVVSLTADSAPSQGRSLWFGHAVAAGLLVLLSAAAPVISAGLISGSIFATLLPVQQSLQTVPGVRTASVQLGKSTWTAVGGEAHSSTFLKTIVFVDQKDIDQEALANRIAEIELRTFPEANDKDRLDISVVYGYDIGIASVWRANNFSHSPGDWRKRWAP